MVGRGQGVGWRSTRPRQPAVPSRRLIAEKMNKNEKKGKSEIANVPQGYEPPEFTKHFTGAFDMDSIKVLLTSAGTVASLSVFHALISFLRIIVTNILHFYATFHSLAN